MGTPNRKTYVANIKLALEGIQAGVVPTGSTEPYQTSIKTVVVRKKDTPPEIHPDDLPQIQIWMLSDVRDLTLPCRRIQISQDIDLFTILHGDDEEGTNDDVDNVRDDIIACMYADPTFSQSLDDSIYVGGFEGIHPDVLIGQLRMQWRLRLLRSITRG